MDHLWERILYISNSERTGPRIKESLYSVKKKTHKKRILGGGKIS